MGLDLPWSVWVLVLLAWGRFPVVALARFLIRRLRAAAAHKPVPTSWSLSLLVSVDESDELLQPTIRILGPPLRRPRIRLELVDARGDLHRIAESPITIGRELALPAFRAPVGATPDEAARWPWVVVLEDRRGQRARWARRLAEAGCLNAEAELV